MTAWKMLIKLALVSCLLGCMLSGCTQQSRYGTKLNFKQGKLYYTSNVTVDESTRFGNFLAEIGVMDDPATSAWQLDKSGSTYLVRLKVKEGTEKDSRSVKLFGKFGTAVSQKVFNGAPVQVQLCDMDFKTILIAPA